MRAPDELTVFLLEQLAPLSPVSSRSMFGGVGLFHNG
ncbi:MAG: TfoX N-terminal domain, partial [Acetobacteraceae bacterium]|nr:TfoX N-terminal domain [Acetobacteraceae bacterium]